MLQYSDITRYGKPARLSFVAFVWLALLFVFGHTAYAQQSPPQPPPSGTPDLSAPAPPPPMMESTYGAPCPPPPEPSLDNLRPYLHLTYVEYWSKLSMDARIENPDCVFEPGQIRDPKTTVRDYLTEFLEGKLYWMESLKPITMEEYFSYYDPKTYGVWLDGKRISNDALADMDRSLLYSLGQPLPLMQNEEDYGKYVYQLNLASQNEFERDIAKVKEELEMLR